MYSKQITSFNIMEGTLLFISSVITLSVLETLSICNKKILIKTKF